MSWIERIEIKAKSGSESATEATDRFFLGMAGREFRMDKGSSFSGNDTIHITFGPTGDTKSAKYNDPRRPRLSMASLDRFPAYVRLEGDDGWLVESFLVTVESRFGDTRRFVHPDIEEEGVWLDELSGKWLYLTDTQSL
ncbi:hypothetical protein SAMN04487819_12042 [Actinopolyspora alba]|uniref:Uncharacterized protein n=1 Tax=Actinopolyspora alba TaxID=673379 RepID=A0A1I2CAM1_9ACTN|nr:hypothetical protein [Actinopolyspora alba]SFE65232.1 hypothetical protein SAMN04487819_12042 [Actinopolyspora alba]